MSTVPAAPAEGYFQQDLDVAAALPQDAAADLTEHFGRRFHMFEEECTEYLARIEKRRQALRMHHVDLRGLESLRHEVVNLQRRLTEVELQGLRERWRALRHVAESRHLHERHSQYQEQAQRLLTATRRGTVQVASTGTSTSSSGCVVRAVAEPHADAQAGAASQRTEVWQEIEAETKAHTQQLDAFEKERAWRLEAHDQVATALWSELAGELTMQESERERLADIFVGFVELRKTHLAAQRAYAEEVEALKAHNSELSRRAEDFAQAGAKGVREIESSVRADLKGQSEYNRRAELIERQTTDLMHGSLEEMETAEEVRADNLLGELRNLRGKCAAHRRRRCLELQGVRADLSLLGEKLAILGVVAEEASERLRGTATPAASGRATGGGAAGSREGRSRGAGIRRPENPRHRRAPTAHAISQHSVLAR